MPMTNGKVTWWLMGIVAAMLIGGGASFAAHVENIDTRNILLTERVSSNEALIREVSRRLDTIDRSLEKISDKISNQANNEQTNGRRK